MIQLYGIMGIGYLVSTLNGFDSSLMGAINAMKSYQNTFGLTGEGSSAGIIFIIYNLGQIAAFPCKLHMSPTTLVSSNTDPSLWTSRRWLRSSYLYLRWLCAGSGWNRYSNIGS